VRAGDAAGLRTRDALWHPNVLTPRLPTVWQARRSMGNAREHTNVACLRGQESAIAHAIAS
jgi:hypothetical protein